MKLTEEQELALVHAAAFLDLAAGEGMGVQVQKADGSTVTTFADDVATTLAVMFDLEMGDGRFALRDAVKDALRAYRPEPKQEG